MATYTSNIPQPGDDPSDSQSFILDNFISLGTAIAQNHVAMTDLTNRGKHNFLQMPEQGAPPTTLPNEGGLFTQEQASATQLFWRPENNGTEQQLTNVIPTNAGNHYSWNFATGLQLRFGRVASGDPALVTFETPFSTDAYVVFLSPIGAAVNTNGANVQGLGTASFTIGTISGGRTGDFYYLAVGR